MRIAYDYDQQQWIGEDGSRAAAAAAGVLLRRQLADELGVLESDDAQHFLSMVGSQLTPAQAQAEVRKALREIE